MEEIYVSLILTTLIGGVKLIQLLSAEETLLPNALIFDLNMPRKSGIEYLSDIKKNVKL